MTLPTSYSPINAQPSGQGNSPSSLLSSRPLRRLLGIAVAFMVGLMVFMESTRTSTDGVGTDVRKSSSRIGYLHDKLAAKLPSPPAWTWMGSGARQPSYMDSRHRNPHRSPKPRAAFVSLVRESNLDMMLTTIRDLQWVFNDDAETAYDYIFFSETPFTDWFKDRINGYLAQADNPPKAHFGVVPKKDWEVPANIDLEKVWNRWKALAAGRIPYALSTSYRQMCRFYSGALFRQPLLDNIDYYWRIEPETRHLCRFASHWRTTPDGRQEWVERDPFRYMRDHKKKYAFTITMKEYKHTIMSLMARVNFWRRDNPQYEEKDNLIRFISDDVRKGQSYNKCHFWTNFEIADLSFFRSEAYQSYFAALDKAGGFFKERWGDAPVHSIAAALMLRRDEIWHVDYAGYSHPPYLTCPFDQDPGSQCACDPQLSFEYDQSLMSCQYNYDVAMGRNPLDIVRQINGRNGVLDANGQNASALVSDGVPYVSTPLRVLRKIEETRGKKQLGKEEEKGEAALPRNLAVTRQGLE